MVHNNTNNITNLLGEPKRYAYKAQPVTLYVAQETGMKSVKCYSVDFEKACDILYRLKRNGLLVKRLRRRPLTAKTGVRFPHGSP